MKIRLEVIVCIYNYFWFIYTASRLNSERLGWGRVEFLFSAVLLGVVPSRRQEKRRPGGAEDLIGVVT